MPAAITRPSARPAQAPRRLAAAPTSSAAGPLARLHPPTAPALRAKAQGADPLPTFGTLDAYRNHVINLVGQAQVVQAELEATRKGLNQGKEGTQAVIGALQERLDGLRLQLMILRDAYPLPSAWTRSTMLLGQGFDKEAFWRQQVEAIPAEEVLLAKPAAPEAPAPAAPAAPDAPAPRPAVTPAPRPAAPPTRPAPPPVLAPSATPGGALTPAIRRLVLQHALEGSQGNDNSAGNAWMRGKLEAMLPLIAGKTDPAVRDVEAIVRGTLRAYDGNETRTHYAYQATFAAVRSLLDGSGTLAERHESRIDDLVMEGLQANRNTPGFHYARARMEAIQRHAELIGDARALEIASLLSWAYNEFESSEQAAYDAHYDAFKAVRALLENRGTLDDRRRDAVGTLAKEGLQANDNSAGATYARVKLRTIQRLTEGSADPALQGIHAFVGETLRQHDGSGRSTYDAYIATFQAVRAMLD